MWCMNTHQIPCCHKLISKLSLGNHWKDSLYLIIAQELLTNTSWDLVIFYIVFCLKTTRVSYPRTDSELFQTLAWCWQQWWLERLWSAELNTREKNWYQQLYFSWMANFYNSKLFSGIRRKLLALACLPWSANFPKRKFLLKVVVCHHWIALLANTF